MQHDYDGELTKDELLTSAPPGLYLVKGVEARRVPEVYDPVTDTFSRDVLVVPVARVRITDSPMPLVGECYRDGERQVLFVDVPVEQL